MVAKPVSKEELAARRKLGDRLQTAQELVVLQDDVRGIRVAINILIASEEKRLARIEELQKAMRPTGGRGGA